VIFTTSWDDGHPLDLRVAELLAKHGFRGTFYVPRRNVEGRSVLATAELRALAAGFEIGGHTVDHVRLNSVPHGEARRQIADSKRGLEDELGRAVAGFCYPGGVHDAAIRDSVRDAGFRYARTIDNFWVDAPADPFRLPTTLQLYPHHRLTYAKNWLRGGSWSRRGTSFGLALLDSSLDRLLVRLLERVAERGGLFHLWGHSWEIDELGLWDVLDRFLAAARAIVGAGDRVDNARAAAA
jgi:peptidoglycan/xylan/chitin deacetylase (PgdA/CDA1 family)